MEPKEKPKIEYHAASIEDIDACEYLYLHQLTEPRDNALRLVIEEARLGREAKSLKIGKTSIPRQLIEPVSGCRVFIVEWPSYISYSVWNEWNAYVGTEKDVFSGRLFRAYSQSVYLDFVCAGSFVTENPDPRNHWGVSCENHIVDVVSKAAPAIRFTYAAPSR